MATTRDQRSATWPYPRWIAHRGAGKLAPENTLAAFKRGASYGYRMFECDVKLSADGEAFLLHDAELERTTSGRGLAGTLNWAELSRLDAGLWHGAAFAGEPLLHLDVLAAWLQAEGHAVNLEIKPTPGTERLTGEVVARRVAQLWADQELKPLLSSFQVEALAAAREAVPALPRALLLTDWVPDAVEQAERLGCIALVVQHAALDASRIAEGHRAGLRMLTYTVNDEDRAQALWAAGLDGLITDRVDLFDPGAEPKA